MARSTSNKQTQKPALRTTQHPTEQTTKHVRIRSFVYTVQLTIPQVTFQGTGHMPFVVLKVGLSAILYARYVPAATFGSFPLTLFPTVFRGFFPREQYHTGIMVPSVLDEIGAGPSGEPKWEDKARHVVRTQGDNSYRFMLLRRNQTQAADAILGALVRLGSAIPVT